MVESEISSFDYGIKIIEHSVKDRNKIKIAQKIFEYILLSDVYKTSFSQGIIKACMFGYSVAEVVLEYEK